MVTKLLCFARVCRFKDMVFEFAFVLQGNSVDELPEHVLGCARLFRLDFLRERPIHTLPTATASTGDSPAASPGHGEATASGRQHEAAEQ